MDLLVDLIFESDDDIDDNDEFVERRPYVIRNKPNNFQVWDDKEFFDRFRLKKDTVLELLHAIEDRLIILRNKSRSLTPINQLLTLRFYATGNFLRACGDFSGVSISTASRVIAKVSMAIASLSATMINMPQSNVEIRTTQQAFYDMYKFPRVIGCIDGTHIRIQSPGGKHAEEFRNRKGFFSLNIVCDHNMRIIDVVARWPGSVHDATIFQHSRLRRRLEEGEFRPGILLGDSGYPIKKYLLTPLLHPTTAAENSYNSAHISLEASIFSFKFRYES
ncbi:Uncharacterized protein DBV15_12231 [Temnothorax longispinosus]|uniref:Putative nuclease HARBI1 n=1 Tax=Temnothorax longispinosus TaxID=300112 RepID=A0A4S2KBL9_9HYME|nr:Uncharacterized protein DBV15_12231 [Temnothorax longispinosus]